MKRVFSLFLFLIIIVSVFTACNSIDIADENDKISVVTTIFPYYDFVREIAGDRANITMLLSPGSESHDYEPSPQDIIKINDADIFIYNGGESDEWVHTIIESIDSDVKVLCMFDYVTPLCSEVEHHHDEHNLNKDEKYGHVENHSHSDYDEHIWTSPVNAINMSKIISQEIIKIDEKNMSYYKMNTENFISRLTELDRNIRDVVNKGNKNTLVIADRFPMLYFSEEYNLEYKSAFPGCSSETQPSIATVTHLIDFVIDEKVPVVFYMDNSNANFAKLISEDTGANVGVLYSCHNITKEQLADGVSYTSLMELNLSALKEAL